ncbi:peroxisome proliferator-activated receptor gamma coactivator 1-alpha isoform X2 [Hydra vulgaris]|uniref:Peroxisome proliferator-activated receptor gamma coactivator 1-alpha isoform X2 n=1 Tax=Hydra vulgaris TaxID=6087 RepID=A0ABM4BKU8_HYDVU
MCENPMALPSNNYAKIKDESDIIKETYTHIMENSSDSFCNIVNSDVFSASLTEQLEEISDYQEMIQGECLLPISNSISGIEASDIGNLLDQFLKYEQGNECYSYPGSTCWSPTESPSEDSNNDSVLGQLMIVKQVLSIEAEDTETISSSDFQESVNNNISCKPNGDGLLRTINGIHPKGDNKRMADSPKFAKFKKKKISKEPPLRRSMSGPTTPRCISPTHVIPIEEIKKREAKLIEALAFSVPREKFKKSHILTNNNVSLVPQSENPENSHILSRLQPVVSKRNKITIRKENDSTSLQVAIDPRLSKEAYGESKNVTQFLDTNLTENSLLKRKLSELEDDLTIVDMTVDHDVLPTKISLSCNTPSSLKLKADQETTEQIKTEQSETTEQIKTEQSETTEHIKTEQSDSTYILVNNNNKTSESLDNNASAKKVDDTEDCKKLLKNYRKNNTSEVSDIFTFDSQVKSENNNDNLLILSHTKSNNVLDKTLNDSKKRYHSNSPRNRSRSKSRNHSRSSSRNRSRSPYKTYSKASKGGLSRSRSRSRSNSVNSFRSSFDDHKKRLSSESDHEVEDINEKLTELSNPVPYDIEHERKLRFLVGKAAKGDFERRNIYVGGISKDTTKSSLNERFQRFGQIEKITLHFRDKGDNYAFIVYEEPEDAKRAIEEGNDDASYPMLELCFGGRRKFVGGSYVDFDGNNSYLEEKVRRDVSLRCESPEDDFDKLLKMALKEKSVDRITRETTPEWT